MDSPYRNVGRILNTVFQMHQMQLHLPREKLSAPGWEAKLLSKGKRRRDKAERAKRHTEHLRRKKQAKKETKSKLQAKKRKKK